MLSHDISVSLTLYQARNHIWVTSTGLSSHTKNIIILNIPLVVFLLMVTSQEFGIILTISCWRATTCWKLFAHCITCVTLRDKCQRFLVTNAWILVRKRLSLWLFTCTLLSYIYVWGNVFTLDGRGALRGNFLAFDLQPEMETFHKNSNCLLTSPYKALLGLAFYISKYINERPIKG